MVNFGSVINTSFHLEAGVTPSIFAPQTGEAIEVRRLFNDRVSALVALLSVPLMP